MRKQMFIDAGREGGLKAAKMFTKAERIERARLAGKASGKARKAKAEKGGKREG
jgi:hypothetical protein